MYCRHSFTCVYIHMYMYVCVSRVIVTKHTRTHTYIYK